MEPVQVKVYGLFPLTRRRYLRQAVAGLALAGGMLLLWWLGWPLIETRLDGLSLPAWMQPVLAVLRHTPGIVLAAVLAKGIEMLVVLRCFSRTEARQHNQDSLFHPPS